MAKKQRIEVKEPPKEITYSVTRRNPVHVLAEFTKHASEHAPLSIEQLPAPCGPYLKGFNCTASWSVSIPDDEVLTYLETAEEIGNTRRLFHGTGARNVTGIINEGLRKGRHSCMFGRGIYFGNIDKAMGYTYGGKANYVFECEVALGTPHVAPQADKYNLKRLAELGCHSVHGKANHTRAWGNDTLLKNEYVIYSPSQILIDKIHEYQSRLTPEDEEAMRRQRAQSGLCSMVIEKTPVVLSHKHRAFTDVLSQQQCGRKAYTRLKTNLYYGSQWVCNDCIQKQKLRVGSTITVKDSYRGVLTVRVTGETD